MPPPLINFIKVKRKKKKNSPVDHWSDGKQSHLSSYSWFLHPCILFIVEMKQYNIVNLRGLNILRDSVTTSHYVISELYLSCTFKSLFYFFVNPKASGDVVCCRNNGSHSPVSHAAQPLL